MKYNWIFNDQSFVCDKSLDGLTNVVKAINWHYGNDIASIAGYNAFAAPDAASFTPFDELTEEQVAGWLEADNDMEFLDAAVDNELAQIAARNNQEILPPPFAN